METVTEINKIEIILENNGFLFKINDGGSGEVDFKVPADNYRQWARVFTRMAMEMWARVDAVEGKKEDEK